MAPSSSTRARDRGTGCAWPRGMLGCARHVLPHLACSGRPRDSLPHGRRLRKPRPARRFGSARLARRSSPASRSYDDGHLVGRVDEASGARPSAHRRLRNLPRRRVRAAHSFVPHERAVPAGLPVRDHEVRRRPRHEVHSRMCPELSPRSPPAPEHFPVRDRQVRGRLHRHPLSARRRATWWRWRWRWWWRRRNSSARAARRRSSEGSAGSPRGAKRPHRARACILGVARAFHSGALSAGTNHATFGAIRPQKNRATRRRLANRAAHRA